MSKCPFSQAILWSKSIEDLDLEQDKAYTLGRRPMWRDYSETIQKFLSQKTREYLQS